MIDVCDVQGCASQSRKLGYGLMVLVVRKAMRCDAQKADAVEKQKAGYALCRKQCEAKCKKLMLEEEVEELLARCCADAIKGKIGKHEATGRGP